MQMLSEDDRNLREMTAEELALAWDLWFDIAQTTNASDPPYTHGVFAGTPGPATTYGDHDGPAKAGHYGRPHADARDRP
ncbi:MAG: hypothetical protein ACRD3C_09955, partial [Vicinamibacterales bacterium]